MGDPDVRLLSSPPNVKASLARGVATGRGRPGAGGTLPAHRLMLTGVEQQVPRLADYCAITGDVLADTVPASWLHVLTFGLQVRLMADRDFPFPMLGMVHVANRMTQHRPVRVSEPLTLALWAQRLHPHRKGHTVDLVGEARVGDEVVWDGCSTYLVRGRGEGAAASTPDGTAPTAEADAEVEPVPPVVPATELATWRLAKDLGRRYAAVSGDVNPIHLSALSAKALGFPRAIAHGMWTHARVLAAVRSRLPRAFTVEAQFVKPILLPSTVVLHGEPGGGLGHLAVTSPDRSRLHLSAQVSGL